MTERHNRAEPGGEYQPPGRCAEMHPNPLVWRGRARCVLDADHGDNFHEADDGLRWAAESGREVR